MNILFTHSYFLPFDQKQLTLSKPYPPLATIQAAAYLRSHDFDVNLFDTNFSDNALDIKQPIAQHDPAVLVIYDDGFNYLTKMCLTSMREAALKMIKYAKSKDIKVIVSSSDSTDHYEKYIVAGADAVILGEAEETLLALVNHMKTNQSIEGIGGIAFKVENDIKKTVKKGVMTTLDDLPIPAWDLIDIEPYKKAWQKHGYFSINIATTRGCPYKCNWCAKPIYGNRYNSRSPEHVVSELKYIKQLFNFDHIWFCDDIFGLKPNWVQSFDKVLNQEGISIRYKIQSRADLLLKDDTLKSLHNSGCEEVWIGAESGAQKILDAMDKGTDVEQIFESTRLMQKHGIKPCFFLQFGYLSENWIDIKATLNMLFDLMPHDIGVSVSYPLPGTKFYDKVKVQLDKKANWTDSDELLLMYKSTFPPTFYKKLHRFIHKRFRQKQALNKLMKGQLNKIFKLGYFKVTSNLIYGQLLVLKRKT